ncbi:MAG: NUDIX domain-containing protein [Planctomycetales bacterium]|nr:NUDIX domain-containing protein [Planctomycetales bacterium]
MLVVPRDHLFGAGASPQGFRNGGVSDLLARARAQARFVPRPAAETDGSLKQLIPYAVVTRRDQVFLLRRLATQSEARLRNLYSLGVGGHVNPEDARNGMDPVEAGLWREVREELEVRGDVTASPIGILNDDRNPVGQVHLGVVYRIAADGAEVKVRETDRMEGRWVSLDEAAAHREGMETWSQLLLDALRARHPSTSSGRGGQKKKTTRR